MKITFVLLLCFSAAALAYPTGDLLDTLMGEIMDESFAAENQDDASRRYMEERDDESRDYGARRGRVRPGGRIRPRPRPRPIDRTDSSRSGSRSSGSKVAYENDIKQRGEIMDGYYDDALAARRGGRRVRPRPRPIDRTDNSRSGSRSSGSKVAYENDIKQRGEIMDGYYDDALAARRGRMRPGRRRPIDRTDSSRSGSRSSGSKVAYENDIKQGGEIMDGYYDDAFAARRGGRRFRPRRPTDRTDNSRSGSSSSSSKVAYENDIKERGEIMDEGFAADDTSRSSRRYMDDRDDESREVINLAARRGGMRPGRRYRPIDRTDSSRSGSSSSSSKMAYESDIKQRLFDESFKDYLARFMQTHMERAR